MAHENLDQNENFNMVHGNVNQIEVLTENHESQEDTNLKEINAREQQLILGIKQTYATRQL